VLDGSEFCRCHFLLVCDKLLTFEYLWSPFFVFSLCRVFHSFARGSTIFGMMWSKTNKANAIVQPFDNIYIKLRVDMHDVI